MVILYMYPMICSMHANLDYTAKKEWHFLLKDFSKSQSQTTFFHSFGTPQRVVWTFN